MTISPKENMQMALQAVWGHRFRSLLTILGIVIGITTVVTVASLLTGLRQGVVTFFDELGPDNVFLYKTSGDPSARGAAERAEAPADQAGIWRPDPPLLLVRRRRGNAVVHSRHRERPTADRTG